MAVFLWGISFVATRVALEAFHPFGLVAVRFVAGTALLAVVLRVRKQSLIPRPEDLPICALLGVVLGAHIGIQAWGLLYTSAINTAWIVAFMPVTIAWGAHVFLGQRLRPSAWLGALVALGGVGMITWTAPPDFAEARFGDFLQLCTCLTWTAYTLLSAGPVARNGSMRVTVFGMAVASILAMVVAAFGGVTVAPVTLDAGVAAMYLGFFCSGAAFFLWNRALHADGASRVGAMLYFEPLVTVAAASVMLDEAVTLHALIGGPVVLLGVWFMGRRG